MGFFFFGHFCSLCPRHHLPNTDPWDEKTVRHAPNISNTHGSIPSLYRDSVRDTVFIPGMPLVRFALLLHPGRVRVVALDVGTQSP
jgi:hypothetical protein